MKFHEIPPESTRAELQTDYDPTPAGNMRKTGILATCMLTQQKKVLQRL